MVALEELACSMGGILRVQAAVGGLSSEHTNQSCEQRGRTTRPRSDIASMRLGAGLAAARSRAASYLRTRLIG
jgi:hypothetical protein